MKHKFLMAALLLCSGRAFAATELHRYTFDGAGVTDSIGTANGTLFNGASIGSGRLNLDGIDDFAQFAQHIIPTTGDFTVAFFAQQLSLQTSVIEMISQGFSNAPGFYIGHNSSREFRIGDDWSVTGLPFPSDGLTHHYAVTKGSDTRLLIDGTLIATFGPIGMTAGGNDTRLGRQFDPFGEYFHGNMDDVRIFSGALTTGEVAALVPEPSTAVLSLGALAIGLMCRRFRNAA